MFYIPKIDDYLQILTDNEDSYPAYHQKIVD